MYSGHSGGEHYFELRHRIDDKLVVERLTGETRPDPKVEGLDERLDDGDLIVDDNRNNNRNIREHNVDQTINMLDDD